MSRPCKNDRLAKTPASGPEAFKAGKTTGAVTKRTGRETAMHDIQTATKPGWMGPSVIIHKYKD